MLKICLMVCYWEPETFILAFPKVFLASLSILLWKENSLVCPGLFNPLPRDLLAFLSNQRLAWLTLLRKRRKVSRILPPSSIISLPVTVRPALSLLIGYCIPFLCPTPSDSRSCDSFLLLLLPRLPRLPIHLLNGSYFIALLTILSYSFRQMNQFFYLLSFFFSANSY